MSKYTKKALRDMTISQLKTTASNMKIKGFSKFKAADKNKLADIIFEAQKTGGKKIVVSKPSTKSKNSKKT